MSGADADATETTMRRPNLGVGIGSHGVRADPLTQRESGQGRNGRFTRSPRLRRPGGRLPHDTLPRPDGATRRAGRRSAGYDRAAPSRLRLRRAERTGRSRLLLRPRSGMRLRAGAWQGFPSNHPGKTARPEQGGTSRIIVGSTRDVRSPGEHGSSDGEYRPLGEAVLDTTQAAAHRQDAGCLAFAFGSCTRSMVSDPRGRR